MKFQKKSFQKTNLNKNNFSNTFKLVFCASMISLSTIFAFIGTFIKIPFFSQMLLTLDISIIFIIPVVKICSLQWGISCSILNAILNFIWDGSNWIGIFILLVSNLTTILIYYFLDKLINKTKKIKTKKIKWFLIWIGIIIFNTLLLTFLNGILFTPLYWWWIAPSLFKDINFLNTMQVYNNDRNLHIYLFGIPNYWNGIFALYSLFNGVKFTIAMVFSIPLLIFFQKSIQTTFLF